VNTGPFQDPVERTFPGVDLYVRGPESLVSRRSEQTPARAALPFAPGLSLVALGEFCGAGELVPDLPAEAALSCSGYCL